MTRTTLARHAQQTMSSSAAPTCQAAAAAAAAARPGSRPNKRQRQQSSQYKLERLCATHHMASTFVPLDPTLHDVYTSHVLAPTVTTSLTPKPVSLNEMSTNQDAITMEAYRYTTQQSVISLRRETSLAAPNTVASHFSSEAPVVPRDAPFNLWQHSPEPPILNRTRRVVETLYGTSMGALAGPQTLSESADKARELQDGLKQAKEAMRLAARQQEEEQRGFERAWQESEGREEESR
ncbi:hypothetical protein ACM66B_001232 [Microbotryomycetes sp. NB124-2]